VVHLPGAGHSQTEYQNPTVKEWMDTYLAGNEKYTTEERLRALFLCQEIAGSKFTGNWMGWAVNASGSPVTGEIFVRLHYDLEKRVNLAKKWAKIKQK